MTARYAEFCGLVRDEFQLGLSEAEHRELFAHIHTGEGDAMKLGELRDFIAGPTKKHRLRTRLDGSGRGAVIRALASQLQVELPESADLSEGAQAKWIWGLSRLSRSVTARAVDWLGLAASDEDWQAALSELRRDGRFASEWARQEDRKRRPLHAAVRQGRAHDQRRTL